MYTSRNDVSLSNNVANCKFWNNFLRSICFFCNYRNKMYLTNDKDNVLCRYRQKVEYLLVSELSIHHRTLSHNLSFTVGRLLVHTKLFLKLLNIHLLPHWHYFKLFTKKPATLCTDSRCLSTVNSKIRNSKEYGRSFISLFVKVAHPPPQKKKPQTTLGRSLVDLWCGLADI